MTENDYPVEYVCSFTEPWGEENFDCVHCKDRAAAIQKAKADLKKYPYVDSIEFSDDELKVKFVPDYPDLRSGKITVSFEEDSWTEHTDDFFDVPIGQIDHADKQSLMRCYVEIARIWDNYKCLKSAFLQFAESENDNIISFIHKYSDAAELVEPIIKKYYGNFDMIDQQILLWSQMYWGGFFRKDFKNET